MPSDLLEEMLTELSARQALVERIQKLSRLDPGVTIRIRPSVGAMIGGEAAWSAYGAGLARKDTKEKKKKPRPTTNPILPPGLRVDVLSRYCVCCKTPLRYCRYKFGKRA